MKSYTPEQTAALEAQGKVIVSASAGSGKTTVMIERIIRLICGDTDVSEILAVTFTKKAAAQMKEKLSKEIIKVINDPQTTIEKRKILKARLKEVPSADISTIHSFCAKLLRRHFFSAGIDNAFRVIGSDDAEGVVLKNEALDELFDESYENGQSEFYHLLSVYWRKKSDNVLRKLLLSTYETLRAKDDYRAYLRRSGAFDEQTFQEICTDLWTDLQKKCGYYRNLVERELDYFESVTAKQQTAIARELIGGLDEILHAGDYFSACAVQKPTYSRNTSSKSDGAEKKTHIERLKYLKDEIGKIYDELSKVGAFEEEQTLFLQSGITARALAEVLLRFDEKYAEKKAARSVLDYNDLEHKTLELLQNAEVAAEVRDKYRYVFVDEYQDVNPVQEKIVSMLSGENLFLVGDVKQSIYGFRGSKSVFFVEKQREFQENGGHSLPLTRNFRSADAVLNAVNEQFSIVMTPTLSGIDYAADSIMERGGMYALNSGKVAVHFLGKTEKKEKTERGVYSVRASADKKETEENLSARAIFDIIQKEVNGEIYDPTIGKMRRAEYADIAILSRKKQGQIGKTVAALSEKGIPITAAATVNICEYSEIKTLIDILSLIDNAEQDIPLCSALLSPMGDCTADDLTAIRLAYPETLFFRRAAATYAREQTNALAEKLQRFYAYYQEIRLLSRVLSAGEILTKILSDTRMETQLLSKRNGVACMRRIHRFIEETSVDEPLGVHAFLDRLRDLDYDIETSENSGENSVKVYTMHSSKGLEYPIVILDNLNMPFRGVDRKEEAYVDEKYGLVTRAFDTEKMLKSNTLLRRLYETKEEKSMLADELNLYYVALTRAQHTLHLLFSERSPIPDPLYARSFAEFTDFSVWEKYVVEDDWFDVPTEPRSALVYRPNETLAKEIQRSFLWQYPYRGGEHLPVKSSATGLLHDEFVSENDTAALMTDTEREWAAEITYTGEKDPQADKTNTEIGLAYHAFLETFDFSLLLEKNGADRLDEAALLRYVHDTLERMREGGAERLELLNERKLTEILSNPVFYELQDMRLYKEQQFLVGLPAKDTYAKKDGFVIDTELLGEEEILFQGAIDLLAVGDGFARVIDYKYSRLSMGKLKEKYRLQLDLYRQAVSKILHIPPKNVRCTVVNIYRGEQIDMD